MSAVKKFYPRIIFVDAPTAFGKDYFIDNFILEFKKKFPDFKLDKVRATDITFDTNTITEDRKYTTYNTDEGKIFNIFLGHINLLTHINNSLKTNDAIIVNRSFLSFLNYNVFPTMHLLNDPSLPAKFTNTYKELFSAIFTGRPSLLVRLGLPGDKEEIHQEVLRRIKSRDDSKPIDEAWIRYISSAYLDIDTFTLSTYSFNELVTSDDYNFILNKYF